MEKQRSQKHIIYKIPHILIKIINRARKKEKKFTSTPIERKQRKTKALYGKMIVFILLKYVHFFLCWGPENAPVRAFLGPSPT